MKWADEIIVIDDSSTDGTVQICKEYTEKVPETYKFTEARGKEYDGFAYTIQVAVEDCTGCEICVEVCPAKNKKETGKKALNMVDQLPLREKERENWDYFLTIPEFDRTKLNVG